LKQLTNYFYEAATVEGMVFYLEKFTCMLSMWDEATMFVASFGRYGNGSAANYDRSVYLEVANAGEVFTRDLKGSRSRINNPRLQICLLGNYYSYISLICNLTV